MIKLSRLQIEELKNYDWAAYFGRNARRKLLVEFTAENYLTEQERKLIFPSIRMFQAGEASDGKHLMKTVERYVKKSRDEAYLEAMKWFIAEENRHSDYLTKYMEYYGVKPRKKTWLDRWFRRIRKIGGLKGEIIVLVTAEMVALTYYHALAECTDSRVLKRICRQMLHDELRHIVFQSYSLYRLKSNPLEELLRICLMQMTVWAVWPGLCKVLRKGGFHYWHFYRESMGYLRQSMEIARRGEIVC